MPQINLAEEFSPKIQKRLTSTTATDEIVNYDYKFDGVDTVVLTTTDNMPMSNYQKSGTDRYGIPLDIGDSTQVMTLSNDRSFTGILDKGDIQDQKIKKQANAQMIQQTDEVLKPEIERYRLQRMTEKSGHVMVDSSLSTTNAYDKFIAMQASLTNALAPRQNRVVLATPDYLNLIKQSNFIKYSDRSQEYMVKGVVGEIDGAKVVEVPTYLMPNGVCALWGNKQAATAVEKLKDLTIHENPPGVNGNLLEGRIRYDLFVLDTKVPLIGVLYESGTLCAAPKVTYTAGSTNTIAITTTTSGATVKYTLDGSDPRDSKTAAIYSAAVSTSGWSSANGVTKVRAYAFKDGTIASVVTDQEVPVADAMQRISRA